MSHPVNDRWIDTALENFDTALSQRKFDVARAVIADVEGVGFTREAVVMRRMMNNVMAEEDDVTFEPYEHPEPPVLESWWQENDVRALNPLNVTIQVSHGESHGEAEVW